MTLKEKQPEAIEHTYDILVAVNGLRKVALLHTRTALPFLSDFKLRTKAIVTERSTVVIISPLVFLDGGPNK